MANKEDFVRFGAETIRTEIKDLSDRLRLQETATATHAAEMRTQSETLAEIRDMLRDALDVKAEVARLSDRYDSLNTDFREVEATTSDMQRKLDRLTYPIILLVIAVTVAGLGAFVVDTTDIDVGTAVEAIQSGNTP